MSRPVHSIVPAPVSYEAKPGALGLDGGMEIRCAEALESVAGLLASWLGAALAGSLLRIALSPGGGAVTADPSGPSGSAEPQGRGADGAGRQPAPVYLCLDASFAGREEYRLEVSVDQVSVASSSTDGLVRGASTLWQLVIEAASRAGPPRLDACRIEDYPRFSWRGFMLDTARNFFPVDFIEKLLDLAALHRLNVFHWHLCDDQAWRLDLPGFPELAAMGSRRLDLRFKTPTWKTGSYSPEDVRRVVAFAARRGITVVPEIESPGHALGILASHPELSCLAAGGKDPHFQPEDRYGVFEDILCAGNEASFAFLERVLDELVTLFPGPFIHMGGDEAPATRWLSCPACGRRMDELGFVGVDGRHEPKRLEAWFMARVAAILAAKGKRLVGWDEILDAETAGRRGPPSDAVVMSWRGYEGGRAGASLGHDVVMCPQTKACYLDHKQLDRATEPGQLGVCTVMDSWSFEALPADLGPEAAAHILGGQATIWTELMYFGRQVEYMVFPRLCAISEALWSPADKAGFADFEARLAGHRSRLDALDVNYYRGPLSS